MVRFTALMRGCMHTFAGERRTSTRVNMTGEIRELPRVLYTRRAHRFPPTPQKLKIIVPSFIIHHPSIIQMTGQLAPAQEIWKQIQPYSQRLSIAFAVFAIITVWFFNCMAHSHTTRMRANGQHRQLLKILLFLILLSGSLSSWPRRRNCHTTLLGMSSLLSKGQC